MTFRSLRCIGALTVLALAGACDDPESFDAEQRGGLLYGLELEEVEQLHEAYLADEALESTIERLSAPFDCSLYGDLCDVVGRDGAKDLTGELVDLALDGADPQDIEDHIDARVDELAASHDSEFAHRATGTFASVVSPSGTHRLRMRSGVFTPPMGSRRAWSQALPEVRNPSGAWVPYTTSWLCVDIGVNTQRRVVEVDGSVVVDDEIESEDRSDTCKGDRTAMTRMTYHARNTGQTIPATPLLPATNEYYIVRSDGTATAVFPGWTASVTSPGRSDTF